MNIIPTDKINITSLEQGREVVAQLTKQIQNLLEDMREVDSNQQQLLSAHKYELIKIRRKVQSQMLTIAKDKYEYKPLIPRCKKCGAVHEKGIKC